jgi:hypothetical protein
MNPVATIIDLATFDDGEQTLQTRNKQTSATATNERPAIFTTTAETTLASWQTTSSNGVSFYSTETSATTLFSLGDEAVTVEEQTVATISETEYEGGGVVENTIYQTGGVQIEFPEVFATASANLSAQATQSAGFATTTRFTASANTQTAVASAVSFIASSTNPAITASFTYSASTTQTTSVVSRITYGVLPQETATASWITARTTGATFQATLLAGDMVENPVTTIVYFAATTRASALTAGGVQYESLCPTTSSATRLANGPLQVKTASGASFGYSQSHTYLVPAPTVMNSAMANTTISPRTIYGPAGRRIGSSLGAGFSFAGFSQTFLAFSGEAAFGRQSNNSADVPDFSQGPESAGTILTLFPTSYTFTTGQTSGSVSIGNAQYSATSATTNTTQTTTSGVIQVHGQTYVGEYRTLLNYADDQEYAPLTQYAGQFVIGGKVNPGETIQERLGPGAYKINDSTVSYFDGRASTYSVDRPTSYAIPTTYLQPIGRVGHIAATNVIAWTVARNSLAIPAIPQVF